MSKVKNPFVVEGPVLLKKVEAENIAGPNYVTGN